LLRRAYAPIRKSGDGVKKEANLAQKEFRAGVYRAAGARAFDGLLATGGLSIAAYAYWPEVSSFVVRNADALRAFVTAVYQNPILVEIINLIVRAASH
jgi:hypothetical protein